MNSSPSDRSPVLIIPRREWPRISAQSPLDTASAEDEIAEARATSVTAERARETEEGGWLLVTSGPRRGPRQRGIQFHRRLVQPGQAMAQWQWQRQSPKPNKKTHPMKCFTFTSLICGLCYTSIMQCDVLPSLTQ